jgi:hypothetical protein
MGTIDKPARSGCRTYHFKKWRSLVGTAVGVLEAEFCIADLGAIDLAALPRPSAPLNVARRWRDYGRV